MQGAGEYLADEVKAEMALDFSPQTLGKVPNRGCLDDSASGSPDLAFVLAHALTQLGRQLPPSHPPLDVTGT